MAKPEVMRSLEKCDDEAERHRMKAVDSIRLGQDRNSCVRSKGPSISIKRE